MSFVITQTQDDIGQVMLDDNDGDIASVDESFGRKTSNTVASSVMAARKPLVQMTLDGPGMVSTPISGARLQKQIHKDPHKGAIQVKSHVRKSRKAKKSKKKPGSSLDTVEVPNNDPKLEESLRLVSKMQFDDLMRYRQIVFYKKVD
jgi:hypothetical protein